MTTGAHSPQAEPDSVRTYWRGLVLPVVAAGLATICSATSLSGVVAGSSWFGYVLAAAGLIGGTGFVLRSLRAPALLVGLAQLLTLMFLVTGSFTSSGIAKVIPGPAALTELNDTLLAAFTEIRVSLQPVAASPSILCLITIALGLVAILIDTLAVAGNAPAATGLVLLCVYAVPASLSETMLPWWTFLLGAAAFTFLLAVDGHTQRRRWATSQRLPPPKFSRSSGRLSIPLGIVAGALALGLIAGTALTSVGTVGRLPNAGKGTQGQVSGGLGINPFTSLRGMLSQEGDVELFRVHGLGQDNRLLRAFTLDTYRPNKGWTLPDGPMPAGVPADQPLPLSAGDQGNGETRKIQIDPINWVDVWLPVYGAPRELRDVKGAWFYDQGSGAVFSERRQQVPAYTEFASLAEPTKDSLRAAGQNADKLSPTYTRVDAVDPRVVELTKNLTRGKTTAFDKTTALWEYFTRGNGFVYDTQTASATDSDALADFVLNGKRGFCEQFASAMGVMLRTLGIPARVAVGFTAGSTVGEYRTITSQDAHAWVEVYFGDRGWVSFDPTPRTDGRGYTPAYLRADVPSDQTAPLATSGPSSISPAPPSTNPEEKTNPADLAQQDQAKNLPSWITIGVIIALLAAITITITAIVLHWRRKEPRERTRQRSPNTPPNSTESTRLAGVLAIAATGLWIITLSLLAWLWSGLLAVALFAALVAALIPALARELTRQKRLHTISRQNPEAADAVWRELLDDCIDRGVLDSTSNGTARNTAHQLSENFDLEGRERLDSVVSLLEKSWYSEQQATDPTLGPAFEKLREQLRQKAPLTWRARLLPRSLFRNKRS